VKARGRGGGGGGGGGGKGERRELAAIMFSDMVAFTALNQTDEALALEVLERHNKLVRPFFPKFDGREIKTIGDSFLVEFNSALDATRCAIEIQKLLHDYNASSPDTWKIKLRIGIHLGDVVRKGRDILGDAVNIASRIEGLAGAEGVCVSQQVYDQVHNKLESRLEKLEQAQLKNVSFATNVYKVVMPWEEKPPSETKEVEAKPLLDPLRIAVLPFASMSPDPNDEYFADGMTEELISTISKISELQVIARTSVLRYKGSEKSIDEIGKELKVGSVLEGSVRKAGEKLRITAQLIEVESDRHIWSETYDRKFDDIFEIQSNISTMVAEALRIRLLPKETDRIRAVPTGDMGAYVLYVKGLLAGSDRSKKGLEEARELFRKSISLDSSFAKAYAALADSYVLLSYYAYVPPGEAYPRAKSIALQALELDPELSEAHSSLASVLENYEWNLAEAGKEYELSLELNPSYARARHLYALHLWALGNVEGAVEQIELAYRADPLSDIIGAVSGLLHLIAGQSERGVKELRDVLERTPDYSIALVWLAFHYLENGREGEAIETIGRELKSSRAG
jgi:adenylate cyclase